MLPVLALLAARHAKAMLARPSRAAVGWAAATLAVHGFIGQVWLELDVERFRALFTPVRGRWDWVLERLWIATVLLSGWAVLTVLARRRHSIAIRRPSAADT